MFLLFKVKTENPGVLIEFCIFWWVRTKIVHTEAKLRFWFKNTKYYFLVYGRDFLVFKGRFFGFRGLFFWFAIFGQRILFRISVYYWPCSILLICGDSRFFGAAGLNFDLREETLHQIPINSLESLKLLLFFSHACN